MKKLIILLFAFVSLNCFGEIINNTKYILFDAEQAAGLIGIDDSINFMVVYVPKHIEIDMYTKDHLKGTITPSSDGSACVVFLSSRLDEYEASEVLIHEMVHMKQLIDGDLQYTNNKGVNWLGRHYGRATHRSPWEIQAWKITKIVMDKLKCICN